MVTAGLEPEGVCVRGGYLKPYESSPIISNMRGWTGGRPLLSRPLSPFSSLLGAVHAKFSFPPSLPYFYIFSPLFLLPPPLFPHPLPPPPSYPVRPIKYYMIADRLKMRGVRWQEGNALVLRSTPGRDKEVMH